MTGVSDTTSYTYSGHPDAVRATILPGSVVHYERPVVVELDIGRPINTLESIIAQ